MCGLFSRLIKLAGDILVVRVLGLCFNLSEIGSVRSSMGESLLHLLHIFFADGNEAEAEQNPNTQVN